MIERSSSVVNKKFVVLTSSNILLYTGILVDSFGVGWHFQDDSRETGKLLILSKILVHNQDVFENYMFPEISESITVLFI